MSFFVFPEKTHGLNQAKCPQTDHMIWSQLHFWSTKPALNFILRVEKKGSLPPPGSCSGSTGTSCGWWSLSTRKTPSEGRFQMGVKGSSVSSTLASAFFSTLRWVFAWCWSAGDSVALSPSSSSIFSEIFSSARPALSHEPSATKKSLPVLCLRAKPLIVLVVQWKYCLLEISLRSCEDLLCDRQLAQREFTPYASRSLFIETDAADTFLISCLISSRPSVWRRCSLLNQQVKNETIRTADGVIIWYKPDTLSCNTPSGFVAWDWIQASLWQSPPPPPDGLKAMITPLVYYHVNICQLLLLPFYTQALLAKCIQLQSKDADWTTVVLAKNYCNWTLNPTFTF